MDIYDDITGVELAEVGVHAGFPNPAADQMGRQHALSLDQLLLRHPSSTYMFRLSGPGKPDEGIASGDIAVIDRALRVQPQDLVIAWQDEGFLLARARQLPAGVAPWGVVSAIVHQYRGEKS